MVKGYRHRLRHPLNAGRIPRRETCRWDSSGQVRHHERVTDKQPEQLAKEAASKAGLRAARWVTDHGRRYVSRYLLTLLATAVGGAVLGFLSLPILAATVTAVALVGLGGYAIFSHKLLHEERSVRRWAFVRGKRMEQDVLDREQWLDLAVLAIMGKPEDRAARTEARRPQELAQALRVVQHKLAEAHAAQHPQPAKARVRRPGPPAEPNLGVVRARVAAREAARAQLEAEIQALATPEAVETQMALEEATRHATSAKDAALRADQEARNRRRQGRRGTQRTPEMSLSLKMHATGKRDVETLLGPGRFPHTYAD